MTDVQLALPIRSRISPASLQPKCLAFSAANQHKIFDLRSPETRIREYHSWMLSRSYSLNFLLDAGKVRKLR